nr:hypothetical protein [uncultured Carboxylicivirga sp.]
MKNSNKILSFLFMGIFTLTSVACSDDPSESCDQFPLDTGSCSAEDITACCDDNQNCYYLYKNEDTQLTLDDLKDKCQVSSIEMSELKLQLDAFTAQLINEARSAAICK